MGAFLINSIYLQTKIRPWDTCLKDRVGFAFFAQTCKLLNSHQGMSQSLMFCDPALAVPLRVWWAHPRQGTGSGFTLHSASGNGSERGPSQEESCGPPGLQDHRLARRGLALRWWTPRFTPAWLGSDIVSRLWDMAGLPLVFDCNSPEPEASSKFNFNSAEGQ